MVVQPLQALVALATHERHLLLREAKASHSTSNSGLFGIVSTEKIHPLDLQVVQIVLQEVLQIGKLCCVDAGGHCEGWTVGVRAMRILMMTHERRSLFGRGSRTLCSQSFVLSLSLLRAAGVLQAMLWQARPAGKDVTDVKVGIQV